MRVVIYDVLSMAIIPLLVTSVIRAFVDLATQCGENRHTDIANFATLIHTKVINTLCGDFYHTIW